jgi:type IV pilus assembly protein PilZ
LNTFFADYTKNISKGGTFIKTTKPLEVGTVFVFVLQLPTINEQLELVGEVVWVTEEKGATADKPAGMGIRFVFQDEAKRAKVSEFVESLMAEQLGQHLSEKLLAKKPLRP